MVVALRVSAPKIPTENPSQTSCLDARAMAAWTKLETSRDFQVGSCSCCLQGGFLNNHFLDNSTRPVTACSVIDKTTHSNYIWIDPGQDDK